MHRLITFGCSFTYGHGLPDCFSKETGYGKEPSRDAWPQLLANKLNLSCINKAKPGAGNFEILFNVLTTEFQPNDLVLISFSYFERYNYYKLTDNLGNSTRVNSEGVNHKNIVLSELGDIYHESKLYWDNWLAIHHCEQFLTNKKIKNFSFFGMPIGARPNKPGILNLENFIDIPFVCKDTALDKKHPGLESHRLLSELVCSKIEA